jgi:Ser/Thr protein kinase RdoA (MazF antagonist)
MSTKSIAHGLDGSLVAPDWPPLTLVEVRTLLSAFPAAGEPIEILSTSPRPFSAASVVATTQGRIFVKRHARAVRDVDGLLEEHRFMEYLRAHGAAVPEVLKSASGKTAIATGEWTYEVHTVPVGVDAYEEAVSWTPFQCANHARSAGAMLARLHDAAGGYEAPCRKPQPLVSSFTIFAAENPREPLEKYLATRPALCVDADVRRWCAEALELLAPFHAELNPLLPTLKPLWTHNDLHASNLFWSDASDSARATAVIDFGLADRTNAVHDLAVAIERNIVEWLGLTQSPGHPKTARVHMDHMQALLDGYESVRPLCAEEAAALAPMTALCHAEFALTEADYFLGVLHSKEKARVACGDYLVGHALWFRSAAGSRLLDVIRAWAAQRAKGAVRA